MNALVILAILGLVGAMAALAGGLDSMAHGGPSDLQHSGQYMAARVGFQAVALLAVIVALLLAHG